jgi:hypothetical protein
MLIVLPLFALTSFFLFILFLSFVVGVPAPQWFEGAGSFLAQVSALCAVWTLMRIWT